MTALPKRKPARRTTMAKPDPEPEQRPVPSWAELTAPLDTSPPVIITQAERAASDAYIDQLRAGQADDREAVDEWYDKALRATFVPLLEWVHRGQPAPGLMP